MDFSIENRYTSSKFTIFVKLYLWIPTEIMTFTERQLLFNGGQRLNGCVSPGGYTSCQAWEHFVNFLDNMNKILWTFAFF